MPNPTIYFNGVNEMNTWLYDCSKNIDAICNAHHVPRLSDMVVVESNERTFEVSVRIKGTYSPNINMERAMNEIYALFR